MFMGPPSRPSAAAAASLVPAGHAVHQTAPPVPFRRRVRSLDLPVVDESDEITARRTTLHRDRIGDLAQVEARSLAEDPEDLGLAVGPLRALLLRAAAAPA